MEAEPYVLTLTIALPAVTACLVTQGPPCLNDRNENSRKWIQQKGRRFDKTHSFSGKERKILIYEPLRSHKKQVIARRHGDSGPSPGP